MASKKTASTVAFSKMPVIALVCTIAFVAVGLNFVLYAGRQSRDDTVDYIQYTALQLKDSFEAHVGSAFDTLLTFEMFERVNNWNIDGASIAEWLEKIGTFVNTGYAGINGQAEWAWNDGTLYKGDVSQERFFLEAVSGKKTLASGSGLINQGRRAILIAVPAYKNGEIAGVLFATMKNEVIEDIWENSILAGYGLVNIIDRKGEFVLKSTSPIALPNIENIFDTPEPMKPFEIRQMLDTMAAGQTGYFEKGIFDGIRLISYVPLGLNDWYVFYAVPENMVYVGTRNIILVACAVILTSIVMFTAFALLIRQSNNRNREKLEQIAFIDPVTGKPNYRKFLMDAENILENRGTKKYSVWYGDIIGFKYINDLFGRETADLLLRKWAELITADMPGDEAYARVNADVFVSLRVCHAKEDVIRRCDRSFKIISRFSRDMLNGYELQHCVGVYMIDRNSAGLGIEDMVYRANVAQKSIKGTEKFYAIYNDDMREERLWETSVYSKMEAALANGEFQLYLQPKVDIQNGNQIMGAEALVRWVSPEGGIIPPSRFIPLFEKNRFIVKLDRYLFDVACMRYRQAILDEGRKPIVFSVNVSRIGILQPDFLNYYIRIKQKYHIPDGCIELEFTESLAFENSRLLQSILLALQANGFLCSMDDFGSGYSSLNVLKSLSVDIIKLDGLFFRQEGNSVKALELVRHVIAMAKAFEMKTVAEGIETEELVARLREMGCNAVQGYYFSKPLPYDDFRIFIDTWKAGNESPF